MMKFQKSVFVIAVILSVIFSRTASASDSQFLSLIHKVQEKSQALYDVIDSVAYQGHSRTVVYFGFKPFDLKMVPLLEEYYFDGFWMKPDSLRMVVNAMRKVVPDTGEARVGTDWLPLPNPFRFIHDPSSIGMEGEKKSADETRYWPLYPFSAGADSAYEYRNAGEIRFEDNRVLVVEVKTKSPNTPGVTGSFLIDPTQETVVGSDVIFNEAASLFDADVKTEKKGNRISFSAGVTGADNHRIKTRRALFYGVYWLPTRIEEEFEVQVLGIKLNAQRIIDFDAYLINPGRDEKPAPADSGKQIAYHRDPVLEAKIFPPEAIKNRLTAEEQEAIIRSIGDQIEAVDLYKEMLGSELVAEAASNMALGKVVGSQVKLIQNIGRFAAYNRVEGLRLNLGFRGNNLLVPNTALALDGGYGFKDERWKAEASLTWFPGGQERIFLDANAFRSLSFREDERMVSTIRNTWSSLLFKEDYRDYYYATGGRFGVGFRLTDNLALKLDAVGQDEESASSHAQLSLFRFKRRFRLNPQILAGEYRGFESTILYRTHDTDFDVRLEVADQDRLGGDFTFTTFSSRFSRTFRTGYHSHLFLHLSGAYAWDALPPQRWFDSGGKVFMDYHGHLRGVGYKAFTGDRMASAVLEYSVNGSAFHDAGLKWGLIRALKFSVWTGAGWSELTDKSRRLAEGLNVPLQTTDDLYHEAGIGVGDVLNIFRCDVIYNSIEGKTLKVGLNFMR